MQERAAVETDAVSAAIAVTFDFGQTLAELDTDMLAARAGERGVRVEAAAIEAAVPEAWATYDRAIRAGEGGHPWKTLMRALLAGAGVDARSGAGAALVDWLWDEQPRRNLWRRPIAGMIDVVHDLDAAGVRVGVVSNSEGRLAELADELGWGGLFRCVADSGRLGVEKPGRAIFDWAAARLDVPVGAIVHVGDSWAADVVGALGAGARAVWFARGDAPAPAHDAERVRVARDAAGTRAALRAWGAPL
jgi:putative hydrolase of the HAD superfamily